MTGSTHNYVLLVTYILFLSFLSYTEKEPSISDSVDVVITGSGLDDVCDAAIVSQFGSSGITSSG